MTEQEQCEHDERALRLAESELQGLLSGTTDYELRMVGAERHAAVTFRVGYLRELVRRNDLREGGHSATDSLRNR